MRRAATAKQTSISSHFREQFLLFEARHAKGGGGSHLVIDFNRTADLRWSPLTQHRNTLARAGAIVGGCAGDGGRAEEVGASATLFR